MEKSIIISGKEIIYTLKINKRGKSIRLAVHPGGKIVVSAPRFVPQFLINKFISDKSDWLLEKVLYFSKFKIVEKKSKKEQREEYLDNKEKAQVIAESRLEYFNKFYNFKWGNVTIRNQKTRWGSCSRKGNLNFNYKIALISKEESDYIIVHELCHLKEFNHGKKFWDLVALTIPKYKEIRSSLRRNALKLS